MAKKKVEPGVTRLGYVLDRSGSMSSVANAVPNMFNDYIDGQKKEEGELRVTLAQFDTVYEFVFKDKPVDEVPLMVPPDKRPDDGEFAFRPRGGTALYDGVGQTIAYLEAVSNPEDKVLLVIHTDGEENSSVEYTQKQVKDKIDKLNAPDTNWTVVFLGSGLDAVRHGATIGVAAAYTHGHTHDVAGYYAASSSLASNTSNLRSMGASAKLMTFDTTTVKPEKDDEKDDDSESSLTAL